MLIMTLNTIQILDLKVAVLQHIEEQKPGRGKITKL